MGEIRKRGRYWWIRYYRWRQVDFEGGTVRLDPGKTKSGEARVFPFTSELRELLLAQRERVQFVEERLGKVVPYVWIWTDSMRRCLPGSPVRDFRGSWQAACRAAGVPQRVLHDLRRTAVRNMIQRGIPERVAMMLAGHKTRTVFDRYAIVSRADPTTAVTKLEGMTSAVESATGTAQMDGDATGTGREGRMLKERVIVGSVSEMRGGMGKRRGQRVRRGALTC